MRLLSLTCHPHRWIRIGSCRSIARSSSNLSPGASNFISSFSARSYTHLFSPTVGRCQFIAGSQHHIHQTQLLLPYKSSARFFARVANYLPLRDCNSANEVLQLAVEHIDELPSSQIAAVWSFISRLISTRQQYQMKQVSRREEVAQRELAILDILDHTMNSLERMSPKDMTTIILSMAKIVQHIKAKPKRHQSLDQEAFSNIFIDSSSEPQEDIFHPLAEAANIILFKFEPRYLSNLAYAHALLCYNPSVHDSTLLDNIADESVKKIKQFNSQDISNMVWAYATLGLSNPYLFQSAGDAVIGMRDLNEFNPQEISNTVWAYAAANEHHPEMFTKVADGVVALDDLKSFKPQNLSNTVWAFATTSVNHPEMFRKVGDAIVALDELKSFKPQDFSNTVWAFATASIDHPELLRKVGNTIVELDDLKSFKPQNLSNTVWAFATAGVHQPELFRKVGDDIVSLDDLKLFTPQNLSNAVWAFATAGVHQPELFRKVGDAIVALDDLNSFKPQNLVNTVWAFATASVHHPEIFRKVGDAIVALNELKSFKPQDFSNIAWTYAVVNIHVPSLFSGVFVEAMLHNENEFLIEAMRQLYQWHLWQTRELSNDGLPKALLDKCHQAFLTADTRSSKLQKDVTSQLKSMDLSPVEEYTTKSGYKLDALVESNGKKIGVEVDGPSHFIGQEVNGRTMLKHRQVTVIDEIPVVSVRYWEWVKLGKDSDKKQEYLRSCLKSVQS